MTFPPYIAHTNPIFIDPTILPFDKICIDKISITTGMMFKVEYELLSKPVIQMFSKNGDIHSHDTRKIIVLRVSMGTNNSTYYSKYIK